MTDMRLMTVGQVVDFCIAFNERQKQSEEQSKKKKRRYATQAEIDAFLG